MLGAILVVSGPTVVGPLLNFVRPAERVQRVLIWEGSLIDPVGGILGALVFSAIVASGYQFGQFLLSAGVGVAGGICSPRSSWDWPWRTSAGSTFPRDGRSSRR